MRNSIMKKTLFTIALICSVTLSAFAQNSRSSLIEQRDKIAQKTNTYLTVKGIQLKPGLRMDTILKELESKGITQTDLSSMVQKDYNGYALEGNFFNHPKCNITILPTSSNKNIVGIVSINFPQSDTFKQLKNDYDNLKAALSDKYEISSCIEKFDDKYVSESTSDYLKLTAIRNGEAQFQTRLYVREAESLLLGHIVLSISHLSVGGIDSEYISLSYVTPDMVIDQLSVAEDDL